MTPRVVTKRPDVGFTLVELLVVMAIIGILFGLVAPAIGRGRATAQASACLSRMRNLGVAVGQYADDHDDRFPRSQHSAFACNELPWGRSIANYLGESPSSWPVLLKGAYHCPTDRRRDAWSYGLNVYFELGPEDDYQGKPDTWRHRRDVPRPAATILFAENDSQADHIMPNFWASSADTVDVASKRHRRSSNYVFTDGHAAGHEFATLYDPGNGVDGWNPSTAR